MIGSVDSQPLKKEDSMTITQGTVFKTKRSRYLLLASILLLLAAVLMLASCSKESATQSENDYNSFLSTVTSADKHMPILENIGVYEEIDIKTKSTDFLVYHIDTVNLKVKYDEQTFFDEIERIEAEYSFLSSPEEGLHQFQTVVDEFEIRIVEKEETLENGTFLYDYPKCFMMIGINKKTQTVSYMFHYDFELDEIKELDVFIKRFYSF